MINIIAVGKVNADYFREAINEYLKRLTALTKIKIIEISESKLNSDSTKDILKVMNEEGIAILEKAKGVIIALDIQGSEITSVELSNLIKNKQVEGASEISFIIGGSNGLSEEVLRKADYRISFGRLTYPHQLMRVILIEQIYRAFTILSNIKYHK